MRRVAAARAFLFLSDVADQTSRIRRGSARLRTREDSCTRCGRTRAVRNAMVRATSESQRASETPYSMRGRRIREPTLKAVPIEEPARDSIGEPACHTPFSQDDVRRSANIVHHLRAPCLHAESGRAPPAPCPKYRGQRWKFQIPIVIFAGTINRHRYTNTSFRRKQPARPRAVSAHART